jgi:hypothetical protein
MTSPEIHYRTVPISSESQECQKGDDMSQAKFLVVDEDDLTIVKMIDLFDLVYLNDDICMSDYFLPPTSCAFEVSRW